MKNQYVADAGDHGKYGILRYLENQGISLAVNWYLTEDDQTSDGGHDEYLGKDIERAKDPELFDTLKRIRKLEGTVQDVETSGLLNASFYNETLDVSDCKTAKEKREKREAWHNAAMTACVGKELVFLDPDNGLKKPPERSLKSDVKYAFTIEATQYYERGQNVLYYCSKARRKEEAWKTYKRLMLENLPEARLLGLTFHGGTQRTYIFILHPEDAEKYRKILNSFLDTAWKTGNNRFTEESIT